MVCGMKGAQDRRCEEERSGFYYNTNVHNLKLPPILQNISSLVSCPSTLLSRVEKDLVSTPTECFEAG